MVSRRHHTHKEARELFSDLCRLLKKRVALHNQDTGAWQLHYLPKEGLIINEILPDGKMWHPVFPTRLNSPEFIRSMRFAVNVARIAEHAGQTEQIHVLFVALHDCLATLMESNAPEPAIHAVHEVLTKLEEIR